MRKNGDKFIRAMRKIADRQRQVRGLATERASERGRNKKRNYLALYEQAMIYRT